MKPSRRSIVFILSGLLALSGLVLAKSGAAKGLKLAVGFAPEASAFEAGGQPAVAFPAQNGPVVFTRNSGDSGGEDLFSINPDGSGLLRLTNTSGTDTDPAVSPNGNLIAWRSSSANGDVWSMNADGSNKVRLTTNSATDRYPSWSPDGARIVFASDRGRSAFAFDLYVMDATGSNVVRLTTATGFVSNDQPQWSPDGAKIVFRSTREGNSVLYTMGNDGSNQTRLINAANPTTVNEFEPKWSPDGTKVVYTNRASASAVEEIAVHTIGGSTVNISNNPARDAHPAFSPDGTKIIFQSDRGHASVNDLIIVDLNGSNPTPLTGDGNTRNNQNPDWGVLTSVAQPSPSPSPSPQWQPVVLTAQQIDQLKAWTLGGRTSVYVKPKFPDAGYRIVSWGQFTRTGNDFTVDASVEKFTGASIQAVVTTAQIFDLGPLADGVYNFNFKTSGTLARTLQFTVGGTAPPPNPIDDQRQFVRQQYLDFLNREPDGPGWDFWTDNITKCSDPARRPPTQTEAECISRQRETTSAAFFISPEFQNTGYFVLRVFRGSLGRFPFFGGSVPADNTKDEFTRDHAAVSAGIVVNNQLEPAVINANKQAFVNQFVGRAEFLAIYGALSNDQYVDKLFQTTAVPPTPAERSALVEGLTNLTETRASVLFKIVDGTQTGAGGALQFQTRYGQVFYQQLFNPAFVQMEYFGYMKRDPDDAGYAFWLGKLTQYPSFVEAEMVLAFISSPEYRARFGQP